MEKEIKSKIILYKNPNYFEDSKISFKTFKRACDISIKNHLFQHLHWSFYGWLNQPQNIQVLGIIYHLNNRPFGCSMTMNYGHCGVYIKPEYRNKGFGTKLLKKVFPCVSGAFTSSGIAGSTIFFNKVLYS